MNKKTMSARKKTRARKAPAHGATLTEMRRTMANRQAARRRQAIDALGPRATTKAVRKPVATIAENKRMGAPIRKRVEKRAQAMMAQGRRATTSAEGLLAKARKTLRKATDIAVGIVEAGVDTMMS